MKAILIAVLLSLLCVIDSSITVAASFQGLGFLPGDDMNSEAYGVSGDGTVVVGYSGSLLSGEAFHWTESGGLVGLGYLAGGDASSAANAVSDDGTIVVGHSGDFFTGEAFRWTAAGGMVDLNNPPSQVSPNKAHAVSADGLTVVGEGETSIHNVVPFRWTNSEGTIDLGTVAPGIHLGQAYGVSADGSVIVGHSQAIATDEAFRWTVDSGMVALGHIAGYEDSIAFDTSADGSVVVGYSDNPFVPPSDNFEAFRWTADSGMVGLGDLPGGLLQSQALSVSANGSVVVGFGSTDNGFSAFVWDQANGMRSVQEILVNDFSLDLTGWTLSYARGISADGTTIVGSGINPNGYLEAWVATITIPEPSTVLLSCIAIPSLLLCHRWS